MIELVSAPVLESFGWTMRSGSFYASSLISDNVSANQVPVYEAWHGWHVCITKHGTINKIHCTVGTAESVAATKTLIWGIYAADDELMPTGPLLKTASFDVSGTGLKTISSIALALAPGIYISSITTPVDSADGQYSAWSFPRGISFEAISSTSNSPGCFLTKTGQNTMPLTAPTGLTVGNFRTPRVILEAT